jgi:energy-coupling factor transporter ATP-binding protein EcfA2
MLIRKAERTQRHLRVALSGPTGAGKTYTALRMAMALVREGGRLGIVDTENSSSSVYAGQPNPDGGVFDFDVIDLSQEQGRYSPSNYIRAWEAFANAGYAVILTDSISHAWAGDGGVLSIVDRASEKEKGNSFAAWRKGTPEQQRFIDLLLNYPGHHIVTMRSKMEYVLEEDSRGRKVPRKVGLSPVQRDGVEYEFDVGFEVDTDHVLTVSKTRLSWLDGYREPNAGASVGKKLLEWYTSATPAPTPIADYDDGSPDGPVPLPQYNPESLRRAFFAKWNELFPVPTQKQGFTKEEVEEIKLRHDEAYRKCLRAWFNVSSLNDVPADMGQKFEEFLRTKSLDDFKAAVDKVVSSG